MPDLRCTGSFSGGQRGCESKTFVSGRLLDTHLSVDVLQQGTLFTGGVLPGSDSGYALHMMGFVLENTRYATAKLKIDGLKRYQLYVDGRSRKELNSLWSRPPIL
mgnify:CR=1 FL=1